jgi:uroporphyrinogen decarboxylase
MNHRERVISAINHTKTDILPFDFWAESATLERMYSYLNYRNIDKLLTDFNVDIIHIEAISPNEKNIGTCFQNFWGERYIYKSSKWGPIREDMPGALSNAMSMDDLKNFSWPSPDLFDYSNLESICDHYHDYAIMYGFADIWERPTLVRGMENGLMDLALNPDWVHFMARKYTDFYKEDYRRASHNSGSKIDIFKVYSDLGTQKGPIISLNMFDEFVAPYLKELADCIHNLGAYMMFHSCGAIHTFINRFIEIGIDILDPIQPVSIEMKPEKLIGDFGGRICFHGGIDSQYLLPYGTPNEIMTDVKHYGDILGSNGGYICCPSHLFQPDVPPENIVAFYNSYRG